MTSELPVALGCPSCLHHIELATETPDALSSMAEHIFVFHADYDRDKANQLLGQARELTEAEVTS